MGGLPNPPKNVVPDDWEGPASWSPRRSPNSERRSAKVQKPSGLNLQKKWFPTRSKKTRWETHFLWTEGPQRHKARSETTTASLGPQNFKDLQDVICKKCGSRRIFKTPLCSIDSGNSAKQQFLQSAEMNEIVTMNSSCKNNLMRWYLIDLKISWEISGAYKNINTCIIHLPYDSKCFQYLHLV